MQTSATGQRTALRNEPHLDIFLNQSTFFLSNFFVCEYGVLVECGIGSMMRERYQSLFVSASGWLRAFMEEAQPLYSESAPDRDFQVKTCLLWEGVLKPHSV
jgi:hypothetical protein